MIFLFLEFGKTHDIIYTYFLLWSLPESQALALAPPCNSLDSLKLSLLSATVWIGHGLCRICPCFNRGIVLVYWRLTVVTLNHMKPKQGDFTQWLINTVLDLYQHCTCTLPYCSMTIYSKLQPNSSRTIQSCARTSSRLYLAVPALRDAKTNQLMNNVCVNFS